MEKKTIEGFKNGIFPLSHDDEAEQQKETSKKIIKKNHLKNQQKLM